ncbi:uncharacterized protein LOC135401217 isoform X2 [Ornithodoros turicata]|uniref:uncharacterized protein LOC135401217 isoform X2 n=1 Tax=Ornithodoros turicata TaxID=34597 RepID=UPI003139FD71
MRRSGNYSYNVFNQTPWEEYLSARRNAFHLKKIYSAKATVDTNLPKHNSSYLSRVRGANTGHAVQTNSPVAMQFPDRSRQVSHHQDELQPSIVATKITLYLQALNKDACSDMTTDAHLPPQSHGKDEDAPSKVMQKKQIFTQHYPQILAKSNAKSKIASMNWCYNGPRRKTRQVVVSISYKVFLTQRSTHNFPFMQEAKRKKDANFVIVTTQDATLKRDEWLIDQAERAERRAGTALSVACHTPSGDSAFNESVVESGHPFTVEERRYFKFLSDITEEILGLGIYSSNIIRRVCQENIERNKASLDKDILQDLADELLRDIGIDSTAEEDPDSNTP